MADRGEDTHTARVAHIYALCEPDTGAVRYIGKADDPSKRLREHLKPRSLEPETHKTHWLRGLLAQDKRPTMRVLETVTYDEWPQAEMRWIAHYQQSGANLVNSTPGGEGGYIPVPREMLVAIGKRRKGATLSPETRARMSASKRGRKHSLEHVERVAAAHRGRKRSASAVANIRASLARPEVREKLHKAQQRKAFIARSRRGLNTFVKLSMFYMLGEAYPYSEPSMRLPLHHCKHGHPREGNTYTGKDGKKHCRVCHKLEAQRARLIDSEGIGK